MAKRQLTPRQLTMLDLAARPQGCSNLDLQIADGCSAGAAHSAMHSSVQRGRVVMVSHPRDPKHRLHAFTSPAVAKAWQAGSAPRQQQVKKPEAPQGTAWRSAPQPEVARHTAGPSKLVADAPSEPVSAPKITYGPSPVFGIAARYYVDPQSVPRFRYGSGDASHGAQA